MSKQLTHFWDAILALTSVHFDSQSRVAKVKMTDSGLLPSTVTFEPVQLKITDVRTLMLLLPSPEPVVISAALDGLARFAEAGRQL